LEALPPNHRKPLKSKSTFAFGKSKPFGLPTFFVGARLDLNFSNRKANAFRGAKFAILRLGTAKPIEKFSPSLFQKAGGVWGNAPCFRKEHFFESLKTFFAIEKKFSSIIQE
jgi:hypothetical protein